MPAYGSDDSPHKVGGGIALASDYVFRGISQTDNHPAIQGSLEYGYEPWGVYLGTWASSVNTMTSDGEIEIRWFGGLRGGGHRFRVGAGHRRSPLPGHARARREEG